MSEIRSIDEREEKFLKLISLKGTIDILRYLNNYKTGQYKDLIEHVNEVTLYNRVKQLLKFDLIIHCLDKKDVRKEWYEITEKGKRVLQIAEDIKKLGGDINLEDVQKTLKIQEMFQGDLMVDNEHTKAVDYYLEKERIWNYFKECIIVQVEEPLWIVDGIILRCPRSDIPIIFERWFNG